MSFLKNLKKIFNSQKTLLLIGERPEYVEVARRVFKYVNFETADDFSSAQKMLNGSNVKYAIINAWLQKDGVRAQIEKWFEQYLDDPRMNLFVSQKEREAIKEEELWPIGIFLAPICIKKNIKFLLLNEKEKGAKIVKKMAHLFLSDLGVERNVFLEVKENVKARHFFWGTIWDFYFR
jgi:hypothetical protein